MMQDVTSEDCRGVREYTLEVCTASIRSVQAAVAGGAKRIELCSALSVGGLTPSLGLLREVRTLYPELRIHVLIRPREGDFVYSEEELRVMERDIEAVLPYADSIVSGAMTSAGDVDEVATTLYLDKLNAFRVEQSLRDKQIRLLAMLANGQHGLMLAKE